MKPKLQHRPSITEAIKAKCCECCGYYSDGRRVDCQIENCPLYFYMSYRQNNPDYHWVFDKWSSSHTTKRLALGLSKEEYIANHIIKPNGKLTVGIPAMLRAKCFRCCNDFVDKRQDCQINNCAIYSWMPYREMKPNLDWIFDSPHTKKHNIRRMAEGLTHNEYLDRYIVNNIKIPQPRFREVIE